MTGEPVAFAGDRQYPFGRVAIGRQRLADGGDRLAEVSLLRHAPRPQRAEHFIATDNLAGMFDKVEQRRSDPRRRRG